MRVTLEKLVAQARDWLGDSISHGTIENVMLTTVKALGLEVADNGEVYSPAPELAQRWEAPRQRNVRWSGSGRRRR